MNNFTDQIDQKILKILQIDASLSMDEISEKVNLSRNACWRRIRRLESEGIIKGRVALVEPRSVNLGLSIFVMIKTNSHESDWAKKFESVVSNFPDDKILHARTIVTKDSITIHIVKLSDNGILKFGEDCEFIN